MVERFEVGMKKLNDTIRYCPRLCQELSALWGQTLRYFVDGEKSNLLAIYWVSALDIWPLFFPRPGVAFIEEALVKKNSLGCNFVRVRLSGSIKYVNEIPAVFFLLVRFDDDKGARF